MLCSYASKWDSNKANNGAAGAKTSKYVYIQVYIFKFDWSKKYICLKYKMYGKTNKVTAMYTSKYHPIAGKTISKERKG